MERVGVIGLGLMGGALADRFRAAGIRVFGYDTRDECRSRLAKIGGEPATSSRDVFESTRLVVLSLPDSGVVREVIEQAGKLHARTTIVDTTTGKPEAAAAMGQRLAECGVEYLDATLTGSSAQARTGELVVTAGGPADVFSRVEPLFRAFAKQWFHVGPWGSGARTKLVVNLVLGLNRAILAEGLAFARQCGLNLDMVLEILRSSAAYSRAMDSKGRKMIDEEFSAEAKLNQHLKDVRLIVEAGDEAGAKLPFTHMHESLLAKLASCGLGECDNSAIIRAFAGEEEKP